MDQEQQKVRDLRGMQCPMPIMETAKAIKEAQINDVLTILADDPAAQSDFEAWSRRTGHTLMTVNNHGNYKEFVIRKTH